MTPDVKEPGGCLPLPALVTVPSPNVRVVLIVADPCVTGSDCGFV